MLFQIFKFDFKLTARPEAVGLASQADVKLALKELFESPTCPDSLFSANNASTIWVIEALREMKIEMGIDVALVGFDDVDFYSLITPPVTAIRQPAAAIPPSTWRISPLMNADSG